MFKKIKTIETPNKPQHKTLEHKDKDGNTSEFIILDDKDKDREIRKILDQLTLNDNHYQNLISRGFTDEEIKEGQYRSVHQWQKLKQKVNPYLAGVNKNGTGLVIPSDGIIIPVKNEIGLFVGWQLRLDNPQESGGKYIWSASEKKRSPRPTVKDGNNELPLAVWGNAREDGLVYLCESTGIKPYLASKRLNAPVIGSAGNNFASSPNALQRALERLNAKKIVFLPDAGAIKNSNIHWQNKNAVEFLIKLGFSKDDIYFAWWNQWDKSAGDIDEIDIEKTKFSYWDVEEYIQKGNTEVFKLESKQQYKNRKAFTPDKTINQKWSDLNELPYKEKNKIIALRERCGGGKTEKVTRIVNELTDRGVIALGNANNLLIQSSKRWGLNHLVSIEEKAKQESYEKKDKSILEKARDYIEELRKDTSSKVALCVDSLIHFNPEDFEGRIVILDETPAMLRHLLTSSTEVSKRVDETVELLKECLQRASLVLCMSADLNDDTCNFIKDLAPEKEMVKILNTYQNPLNIKFINKTVDDKGERANDHTELLSYLKNGKTAIFSDSKLECKAWYNEIKTQKPNANVFIIHGENSSEDEQQAFLADPNKYLVDNNIHYLIASSSCKEGLNINLKGYFDQEICIFLGVLDVDSLVQMVHRVRDNVDSPQEEKLTRYIFAKTSKISNNTYRSPFWTTNIKARKDLLTTDFISSHRDNLGTEQAKKFAEELIRLDKENPADSFWSKIEAIDGYEQGNLRDSLRETLENAGHNVEEITLEGSQKDHYKQIKEDVKTEDAERIFYREPIGVNDDTGEEDENETYETLKDQNRLVARDKVLREDIKENWFTGIEKTLFWDEPNNVMKDAWSPELIKYVLSNRSKQSIERFWMLVNPEAGRLLSQMKWDGGEGSSINCYQFKPEYSKVSALRKAGILNLLERDENGKLPALHKDHDLVQNFLKQCKGKTFKQKYGKTYTKGKQEMRFVREALNYVGCDLSYEGQDKEGKRKYVVIDPRYAKPTWGVDDLTSEIKPNINQVLWHLTNVKLCRIVRNKISEKENPTETQKRVFQKLFHKMHETLTKCGLCNSQQNQKYIYNNEFAVGAIEGLDVEIDLGITVNKSDKKEHLSSDTKFSKAVISNSQAQISNYDKFRVLIAHMKDGVKYYSWDLCDPLGLPRNSDELFNLFKVGEVNLHSNDGYYYKPSKNQKRRSLWSKQDLLEFAEMINETTVDFTDRLTMVFSTLKDWGKKWWEDLKIYLSDTQIVSAVENS